MILAFTGTRRGLTNAQRGRLAETLNDIQTMSEDGLILLHGGAPGADAEADFLAARLEITTEVYPSTVHPWTTYTARPGLTVHPPAPPLKRNVMMVRRADRLIACPAGADEEVRSGTWYCYRRMKELNKSITLIFPTGEVKEE